jgi:NADH-quinone oxidoreductase subunit C/D
MSTPIVTELQSRFGLAILAEQPTADGIPTLWVGQDDALHVLRYLKTETAEPYRMLYDLTVIDERERQHRQGQPDSSFAVVYHLLSFERNSDVRVKVPLQGANPALPTITGLWQAANWYEREAWDLMGITFTGHSDLRRILLPRTWQGHPLRKEYPARATECGPVHISEHEIIEDEKALAFDPAAWGLPEKDLDQDSEYLFLNLGPHHTGTHGPVRYVLQLDGEEIRSVVPDIGFHHRGAEKMAERQTWHTYIPYTDRVDYLAGVTHSFAYVLAVEKLAGITVPPRAQAMRVMLAELFRLASHLVWFGTFASDIGAMSPVFFTFTDRERIFDIVEAITGGRMHPSFFRIGGVALDLPEGWERLVDDFLAYLPGRLKEYDRVVVRNRIFQARTRGIGAYTTAEAIEWGVTGAGLRSTGLEWDFRKKRPYSGYEQFEFDVPIGVRGDCYDRTTVRMEEMRQSLRIIEQCVRHMPDGPYQAEHPLATPPAKARTLHDIETLIDHFVNVAWGPVIPAGEAHQGIEATKGNVGYYLISDGDVHAYRCRIRTPSFPHLQMVPLISTRGAMIADFLAILGAVDYVLADVDR